MITSHSNPKIKQIAQWQARAGERRSAGIFLAEGFKMFQEAPEEWIREVYVSEEVPDREDLPPDMRKKLAATGFETVASGVFRKMSDTQSPQGILCVLERPRYSLEELLGQTGAPLFLVAENLQDPGNLGTIVRTGEGAGVTGIILGAGTVDVYNPKVIRATMGSVYRVPVVCVEDLCGTVDVLRGNGVRIYAAHLEGKQYYDSFSFRRGTAFLIGNEGNGLSRELAAKADCYLKIPMEGRVESLNAAVTASILMYEAHRQRRGKE